MNTLDREQSVEAFKHITQNVMLKEDSDSLMKALDMARIDNIQMLLSLDEEEIKALKYEHDGNLKVLDPGSQNEITALVAYLCHRVRIGTPVGNDYLSITYTEFSNYQFCDYMYPTEATDAENERVTNFLKTIYGKSERHNYNVLVEWEGGEITSEPLTSHATIDQGEMVVESGEEENSNKVEDIIRAYGTCTWQSEPQRPHQNDDEHRYTTQSDNVMTPEKRDSIRLFTDLFLVHRELTSRTYDAYHMESPHADTIRLNTIRTMATAANAAAWEQWPSNVPFEEVTRHYSTLTLVHRELARRFSTHTNTIDMYRPQWHVNMSRTGTHEDGEDSTNDSDTDSDEPPVLTTGPTSSDDDTSRSDSDNSDDFHDPPPTEPPPQQQSC
jgi:hypothetical protein